MKANELKKGTVFLYDGKNIMVKHLQVQALSLIHISEPTRLLRRSRMPSSA